MTNRQAERVLERRRRGERGHAICQVDMITYGFVTCFHADIDECRMEIDRCNENCLDTVGSYTCNCNAGYTLNSNGFTCDGMLAFECVVKFVSSCTLILQTSMNAVQTRPILVSMLASTLLGRTLAVATMDMCLILMETLVEVSSALLCFLLCVTS